MEKPFEFLETEEPKKTAIRLLLLCFSFLFLGTGMGALIFMAFSLMAVAIGLKEVIPSFFMFSALLTVIGILSYTDLLGRKDSWILNKVLAWFASRKTSS